MISSVFPGESEIRLQIRKIEMNMIKAITSCMVKLNPELLVLVLITGDQKKIAFEVLKLESCGFLHCVETVMRILNQAKHIFNENLQKNNEDVALEL